MFDIGISKKKNPARIRGVLNSLLHRPKLPDQPGSKRTPGNNSEILRLPCCEGSRMGRLAVPSVLASSTRNTWSAAQPLCCRSDWMTSPTTSASFLAGMTTAMRTGFACPSLPGVFSAESFPDETFLSRNQARRWMNAPKTAAPEHEIAPDQEAEHSGGDEHFRYCTAKASGNASGNSHCWSMQAGRESAG